MSLKDCITHNSTFLYRHSFVNYTIILGRFSCRKSMVHYSRGSNALENDLGKLLNIQSLIYNTFVDLYLYVVL